MDTFPQGIDAMSRVRIAPCDSAGVTPCALCHDPIHHRRKPELYLVNSKDETEAMLCIACALCIDEDTTMTLMHDRVGNDYL